MSETEDKLARELEHAKDIIRVAEQLAELDEHRDSHELREFESCEICGENGKWAHLNRHYERLTSDYGLALAKALRELTEQRGVQQSAKEWREAQNIQGVTTDGTWVQVSTDVLDQLLEAYASSRLAAQDELLRLLEFIYDYYKIENSTAFEKKWGNSDLWTKQPEILDAWFPKVREVLKK